MVFLESNRHAVIIEMSNKTNRALIATTAAAAAVGCFATFKLYQKWQKVRFEKERCLMDHANDINAEDLEILARSGNYALRKSAEQVLADRMVTGKNLSYLLQQCLSENKTERKKALCVLNIVSKTRAFKSILVKNNALRVVFKCIGMISDDFQVAKLAEKCYADYEIEQTLKFSIVTLFDLISENEKYLKKFFKSCKELVGFLLELICDPSDSITTDIRRLSILILQQMMQNEEMRCNLISYGMIQRTSLCFLRTLGDAWLSRNCLQILVMHINLFEDYVTEEFLQEMAQLGVIPVLIGCLKSDDSDLVYWSTALIHEFLLKDLHRGVIAKIPNLVKTLYQILVSSESNLQRLILRIYCFLSINDDSFKGKLVNFKPLMKRLSVCLASGNSDLVYWSLVLVHDLAMTGKQFAVKMINANEDLLKSVMGFTENTSDGPWDMKHVAETLGFFCSCESLHRRAVEAGCVRIILNLLKSDSTELQFWASSLLLNLSMSSDDARSRMIRDGGVGLLLEMAVKESEVPQITSQASKILVMLGFTDASLQLYVRSGLESNIKIDDKEYCPMKHGVNMVTINFLDFKISKGRAFNLCSTLDAVNFLAELKKHRKNELVILTTQGDLSAFCKEPQNANIYKLLQDYGLDIHDPEDCNSWCVIAQVNKEGHIKPISSKQSQATCDVMVSLGLADQVCSFVQEDLLKPLLNILMSSPARANISKVPELEILSTLARHEKHRAVMLSANGFLEYLSELIWCFSCIDTEQLATKPLIIAHCVGALKICHSLSINLVGSDSIFDGPVFGAVKSFLLTSCSILLVGLKEDADYLADARARVRMFTPDEEIFIESGTPKRDSDSAHRFPRQLSSSADRVSRGSELDSQNAEREIALRPQSDVKRLVKQGYDFPVVGAEGESGLVSPFCADSTTQGDQIQALIAQVTFEKTFTRDGDSVAPSEGNIFGARSVAENVKDTQDGDAFHSATEFTAKDELSTDHFEFLGDNHLRRGPTRESRLSERSRSSRKSERYEEADNYHYDYDEFEEEDLPPIPDFDDDDLGASHGRGLLDMPRMASAQRVRSASGFNPNDWPTTGSGRLSRALNEAALRAKSPLKDIASDLEDFDEALVNLTNYALMTVYFAVKSKQPSEFQNENEISRLVHLLWCILLGCKQENRIQWGMIVSAVINQLCTKPDGHLVHEDATEHVKLDIEEMTPSMIISNDHFEIYNGNWTFESICATNSVSRLKLEDHTARGWYYEVTVFSKGIMQIGWTSDISLHEPEKGLGIGDNSKSVGFDGSRCKLWNGQGVCDASTENNYGKKWFIGDTLSCMLSVDGEVSYWLNGQDLGIGLRNIDTSLEWYPGLSLSLDQQCRVNFGHESFLYEPPSGFISIVDSACLAPSKKISTATVSNNPSKPLYFVEIADAEVNERDGAGNRSSSARTQASAGRKATGSRDYSFGRSRADLDFSPKDLVDSSDSLFDVSEIMYYEVKRCQDESEFEIGYQSSIRDCRSSCKIKGNKLFTSNNERDCIQFSENVGFGLIWPLKKIFFAVDGIGLNVSVDLLDADGLWTEDLDEIIPYFSKSGLQINFGQHLFWSHTMNLSLFRRNCFQLMYDGILRSEEGI